ncbi:MAG: MBL fold metallo-hydrolase [Anaerolineales bacterium]
MSDFERVTESIYRLEVRWNLFGLLPLPVCVWLVRAADSWVLVDSGPPQTADQIVAAVERATGGQGVQRVVLTHGHYDHAGGLGALRLAWTAPVLCHAAEAEFVTGERSYGEIPAATWHFSIGRFLMQPLPTAQSVGRKLERGQSVEGMAVIHLPGHTPGHIGLLHPSDRAVICGDTLMTLRGRISPPFILVTPDPVQAGASIRRLGELDFAHLLPSHGPPILERGREAVLEYLGEAKVSGQW